MCYTRGQLHFCWRKPSSERMSTHIVLADVKPCTWIRPSCEKSPTVPCFIYYGNAAKANLMKLVNPLIIDSYVWRSLLLFRDVFRMLNSQQCAMMTSSNGNIFRVTGPLCGNSSVTRSFDVFFDLRRNKRLSKQSWGWWFETLSSLLWRRCNDNGAHTRHQNDPII